MQLTATDVPFTTAEQFAQHGTRLAREYDALQHFVAPVAHDLRQGADRGDPADRSRRTVCRPGARSAAGRARTVPALEPLSAREVDVLHLLALGFTSREIGKRLFVSARTVETHRSHIMGKLKLETRAELVLFALANGLIGAG